MVEGEEGSGDEGVAEGVAVSVVEEVVGSKVVEVVVDSEVEGVVAAAASEAEVCHKFSIRPMKIDIMTVSCPPLLESW